MVERRVAQPVGLQLSSLAQPHIIEISSPARGNYSRRRNRRA